MKSSPDAGELVLVTTNFMVWDHVPKNRLGWFPDGDLTGIAVGTGRRPGIIVVLTKVGLVETYVENLRSM